MYYDRLHLFSQGDRNVGYYSYVIGLFIFGLLCPMGRRTWDREQSVFAHSLKSVHISPFRLRFVFFYLGNRLLKRGTG